MRDCMLAVLLMVGALGLSACTKPYETARREVNRITTITQSMESGLKHTTRSVLEVVVMQEKEARAKELRDAGCNPELKPPASQPVKCVTIWENAYTRYKGRTNEVVRHAQKVDAAIGATYDTLLLTVEVIGAIEHGSKFEKTDALGPVLVRLNDLYVKLRNAYKAWKEFADKFTEVPAWLP